MSDDRDSLSAQAGVREGDVLAGKYRIDKILGVGGMGVVVAGHHIHLDDRVAIKFLLPDALKNQEAVARFSREARAAVKIKSEHVVRVSDVGTLESGAPYMVMEFLEGEDLSSRLDQRGPLAIDVASEFVLQACEAVAQAHALGIVHRDLKPANLHVSRGPDGLPTIKVLDFGISKVTGMSGSGPDLGMTKTAAIMGSPFYMSPEQMQSSRNVDARTDIWALGVILYELVTNRKPFEGETMPELVLRIMQSPPMPLRNVKPDAPPGFDAVILRCLEKDRGKRYQTVGELARDLVEFAPKRARVSVERISSVLQAAGLSASALALPPSSDEVLAKAAGTGTVASWGQTAPGGGQNKAILGAAAAAFAVVVTVVVLVLRGSHEAPKDTAPAASIAAAPPHVEPPAPPPARVDPVAVVPASDIPGHPPAISPVPAPVPVPVRSEPARKDPASGKSKAGAPSGAKLAPGAKPPPPGTKPAPATPAAPPPPAEAPALPKATPFDDRK